MFKKGAFLLFKMIAEENREMEAGPLASNLKLSSKASAFSIAAIIGEQSMSRSSDNVSPSGKYSLRIFILSKSTACQH